MKQIPETTKRTIRQRLTGVLVIAIVAGLLLSACGNTNAQASENAKHNNTPTPTPTISATTANNGDLNLQTFQQWIKLMQQYKGDITTYQKEYETDKQALQNAHTDTDYNSAVATLSSHINDIKLPVLKTEASSLHQTLEDKVSAWAAQHTYHDDFNGQTYQYGYEYQDTAGVIGDDTAAIKTAQTAKDLQQVIEDFNTYLVTFQAMTEDANDKTPYNQPHKTDTDLIKQYGNMQGKVLVVSLYEQALRIYNNGQLVNSFEVTTGETNHPSLPGTWYIEAKESPTVFKSVVPKGDPDYYPDTPINVAAQYHSGGYFLHDAWWRNDYGPGTQFPHSDSSGNSSSSHGSHGCVNIQEDNAHWVYDYVNLGTNVIIY